MKVRNLLVLLLLCSQASPKVVEYLEDAYLLNASQELIQKAEKVAQLMDYDKKYELLRPTKAGIQINPANNFIAQGINPGTHNDLIVVNEFWFSKLPDDQQTFLLARVFETLKRGALSNPLSVKIVIGLFVLLRIIFIVCFFLALGFIAPLADRKLIRFLLALVLNGLLNVLIVERIENKVRYYFAHRHDVDIIQTIVQKTGNKQAALEAFQSFKAGIQAKKLLTQDLMKK